MIPKKLSPGDTIGIVAPSTAVQPEMEPQLKKGLSLLRSKGFNIKLGQHIRSQGIGSGKGLPQADSWGETWAACSNWLVHLTGRTSRTRSCSLKNMKFRLGAASQPSTIYSKWVFLTRCEV